MPELTIVYGNGRCLDCGLMWAATDFDNESTLKVERSYVDLGVECMRCESRNIRFTPLASDEEELL
jgi:hypothetical protein